MAKKKVRRPARRFSRSAPRRQKETVRVKTFIVEKPVYVSAERQGLEKVRRSIVDEAVPSYYEDEGDYSRRKHVGPRRKYVEEGELAEEQGQEPIDEQDQGEAKEDLNEFEDEAEQAIDEGEEQLGDDALTEKEIAAGQDLLNGERQGHYRSRGLFNNVWWKKGALQGFVVWLAIVLFSYFMEFFDMVNVEGWKNWGIFLVILVLLGMIYQKYFNEKAIV